MVISTKLAAAVMSGLLLAVSYAPAWAGSAGNSSAASSATAPAADRSLIGVLSPLLADAAPHQAQKACKPDSLYSQHSVVGDPASCFINRFDVRVGGVNPGMGGVF